MFEFNAWDCYNNEYVCFYRNGTHHVILVEGDENIEVFAGSYEACRTFVDNTLLAAQQSMY